MRKISKDKIIGEIAAVAFSDCTKFVSLEKLHEAVGKGCGFHKGRHKGH